MNNLSLTLMLGGEEQWQEAESLQMQLLERWDNVTMLENYQWPCINLQTSTSVKTDWRS